MQSTERRVQVETRELAQHTFLRHWFAQAQTKVREVPNFRETKTTDSRKRQTCASLYSTA
jgi:hypothetical protein